MKNNFEIEGKVLEIDKADIERRLRDIGAKKSFSNKKIIQENYYTEELKNKKASLRIRKIDKEVFITFKEFKEIKNNVKNFKEIEFKVNTDFKTIQEFFRFIGLRKYPALEKTRTSYKLKDITFDIDEITKPIKIPCYLEIEANNYKGVEKALKLLKIPKNKMKPWNTGQLFKYYKRWRNA